MTDSRNPNPAHGAPDEARDRMVAQILIRRLHGLLRSARIYDENNRTYQQQVEEFLAALAVPFQDETSLVGMGDCFYVNGVRMRTPPSQVALFRALQEELSSRGLSGIRFLHGLSATEVTAFLHLFLGTRTPEEGSQLPEIAAAAGILRIVPVRTSDISDPSQDFRDEDDEEDLSERDRAREMMAAAVQGTQRLLKKTVRTGKPPLRHARRLLQPIVDSIQKEKFSIIGLTSLKDHDEYTYEHCVNVGVVSIAIGQQLGLSRSALANLGVAGLMHDLGKLKVHVEVLCKPGALTPDEWRSIHRHPLEGVNFVSRTAGLSTLMLDTMRVEFEHHLHPGGGGYPKLSKTRSIGAFARIVSVADVFDALTAHRAYRSGPFTGYEALGQLINAPDGRYDRAVLWALVGSVGLYPAGTLMETASGHVVVSLSPNPKDVRRPFCRLLQQPGGAILPEGEFETWDPMPAHETIVRVIAPEDWPGETSLLLAA